MSQWTHVNAIIRFDGLSGMVPPPQIRDDVPTGSEGPLNVSLEEVGDGMLRFVGTFWGDLRDYSDVDEIVRYFTKMTEPPQMIRSGILEIAVEYGRTIVMRHQVDQTTFLGQWVVASDTPYEPEP